MARRRQDVGPGEARRAAAPASELLIDRGSDAIPATGCADRRHLHTCDQAWQPLVLNPLSDAEMVTTPGP